MTKIIQLDAYRRRCLLRVGFGRWRLRFDQTFQAHTSLADLAPETLYQLSQPGGEAIMDLYSLILGFLGYDAQIVFDDLEAKAQTLVLDIYLFLSDQLRFEMMHRLGWLDRFLGNQFSLLEIVRGFEHIRKVCQLNPPALAKAHADYKTYRSLYVLDQQVYLRRLFPCALAAFKDTFDV